MPATPNILNYFIGKGYATWTPDGGSPRDLGNIVECETTPEIDELEHKTSRVGISKTDRKVVREVAVKIRFVLDEITAENVAMLLGSEVVTNTDLSKSIRIMSKTEIRGALTFTGTNEVGNVVTGSFPVVSFIPSGSFSLISDEFASIEITGDLLATTYTDGSSDFGAMHFVDAV